MDLFRSQVLICGGTGCTSSNSVKISDLMKEELIPKTPVTHYSMVRYPAE